MNIDHLDNGDRFKYSFMCILISLLGLIQVQRFYLITDTETRPRRLIKMHIKEYLNRSPLCKWSIANPFYLIYENYNCATVKYSESGTIQHGDRCPLPASNSDNRCSIQSLIEISVSIP